MTTTGDDKKIRTAVGFLNNPKVIAAPDDKKREFLKKKGLTDEEITKAFKMAKEELEKKKKEEEAAKETKETTSSAPAKDEGPQMSVEEMIEKAKQTNSLFLKRVNIKSLPAAIFELTNLETLIINGVTLDKIPAEIAKLTNLHTLHIVGCNLFDSQIPKEMWSMGSIEELNLSKNKLANIKGVTAMKNLKVADFSENQILAIPTDINKLEKLESLNMRDNNISVIPNTIGNIKTLQKFFIRGNNLDKKVDEIVRKEGLKGLINYLNEDY